MSLLTRKPVVVLLAVAGGIVLLAAGRADWITGTVDGVRGLHLVDVTYSRLGAKQVMGAWIRLLALTAAGTDDEGWQASTLGKGSRGKVARTSYGVLPREAARSHLTTLLVLAFASQRLRMPAANGKVYRRGEGH